MANYKFLSTVLLTIGSVVGVREYLKPRDIQSMLKWNGIRLVSNDDGWKSAFYENKDKLEKLGVKDSKELWKWCSERFKYGLGDPSILAAAEEFCKDDPKTVMGNIIRAGEEGKLIKPTDKIAPKIIYVLSGDREQLIKATGIEADEKQRNNYAYMGEKISKWCEAETKKNVVNAEHLSNVKKYCYNRGVKTIKELLTKEGLKTMTSTKQYEERFQKELNRSPELISQIKNILGSKRAEQLREFEDRRVRYRYTLEEEDNAKKNIIPWTVTDEMIKNNSGQYLKWWCESKYKSDLTSGSIFPEVYSRVKSRCTTK